jgi:hypothetical protein
MPEHGKHPMGGADIETVKIHGGTVLGGRFEGENPSGKPEGLRERI